MVASPADDTRRVLGTLEIGRLAAASLVVVAHLFSTMPGLVRDAQASFFARVDLPAPLAVQFFFVLSGFVMAGAHGADRGRFWSVARHFLWRRACRIYPMYWLALALAVAMIGAPRGWHAAALLSLSPAAATEDVPPAWTLRYEVEFYLASRSSWRRGSAAGWVRPGSWGQS